MKTLLLLLALCSSLATNLSAQTESTAPVVWERYLHSDLKVSVNLPKMPVVIAKYDTCKEELTKSSYAYAEGAVYELTVVAGGIRQGIRPRVCSIESPPFDPATIDQRLAQLRLVKAAAETKTRIAGLDAFTFTGDKSIRVFVPDIVHKRWIELGITHYSEDPPDRSFFDSIQLDASDGKEIADGSIRTLGDPPVADEPPDPTALPNRSLTPVQIVAKPHARYTEEARKAGEKGTVRLKVTLQANGAVGAITPLTQLKYGLTEQAVLAARRLVFLPKRAEGKALDATLSIEYSFRIY